MIVPDGVLFGSSTAHRELRRRLVDENQLEAVISLPSGVFKPYAGMSQLAILVFSKGGQTKDVLFVEIKNDGFSLDDKRDLLPPDQNDLPFAKEAWANFRRNKGEFVDRTAMAFTVDAPELRDSAYDLSLGRYQDRLYKEGDVRPTQGNSEANYEPRVRNPGEN